MNAVLDRQPRETAVPCQKCGLRLDRRGVKVVATWTTNYDAICDIHKGSS